MPPPEGQEVSFFSWHLFPKYNDHAVRIFRDVLGADILYADRLLK